MRKVVPALIGAVALALSACGSEDDYANEPRPPVPVNVSAAVSERSVSISPDEVGAGQVVFIVANQTTGSHRVTIETDEVASGRAGLSQTTAPINPGDTATLKIDLRQGEYAVHTDDESIEPARLVVGESRPSAQDDLLLP